MLPGSQGRDLLLLIPLHLTLQFLRVCFLPPPALPAPFSISLTQYFQASTLLDPILVRGGGGVQTGEQVSPCSQGAHGQGRGRAILTPWDQ